MISPGLLCTAALLLPCASLAAPLLLKSGAFDTAGPGGVQIQSAPHDPYWLVQFAHAPGPADLEMLRREGAEAIGYVPEDCYLVRAEGDTPATLAALPGVIWVGHYLAQYRVDPAIADDERLTNVTVLTFPGADIKAILRQAGQKSAEVVRSSDTHRGAAAILTTTGRQARRLAEIAGVRWVEPWVAPKLLNDVARGLVGADKVWQDVGLFGGGQIVAVADTGLDVGASSPSLAADFQGRMSAAFALGRPGLTNDPHGHGTHVAGSVLGSGRLSGSTPETNSYQGSFAGVAPKASLVMQCILDASGGLGGLPADLNDLLGQAYAAGARIHTNSWGADTSGSYEASSAQVDRFVWDHPDMTVLFAAGNEGIDGNSDGVIDIASLNSPGSAKNSITVGASESQRASGGYQFPWATGSWASAYPENPISSDFISDDPGGMAAFSSRGPCADGRIKPDVTAPGTNILSVRSHDTAAGTLWGAYSTDYTYSGGTSMATPVTAGAATLVRQYHLQENGTAPSAALVKATLMATATDLSPGQYGEGIYREMTARPNNVEGWGLIDMGAALSPVAPNACVFVDEKTGLTTGQQMSYTAAVVNTSVPLSVLLVWSDYPGDPSAAKALVNDLDLIVQAPDGTIRNGNDTLDRLNNAEGVDILAPQAGTYTIKVSAFKAPQGPQPFAVVIRGGLPRSQITGLVLSSRASRVPGVTITAASESATYTALTGPDGTYSLSVPEGTYSVAASRTGWEFSVLGSPVVVPEAGVSGIDFVGTAPNAAIVGHVYLAGRQAVVQTWESPHPYTNNTDETVTIVGPANVVRIRAHFSQIRVESGFDFVKLRSSGGGVVTSYSGTLDDFWTPWVPGNSLQINLTSDISVTDYGWVVDRCEIDGPGDPAPGVRVTEGRSSLSTTTNSAGHFAFANLEPLPAYLVAESEGFTLYPSRIDVTPDPGGTASGLVFVAVPEAPVAHIDIAHTYIGDLTVTVGVGSPANPLWSQVVSSRQGGGADRLVLDVALDDAANYYPPSPVHPWFLQACDEAMYDTGRIDGFSVSKGDWTWPALDTPTDIGDNECAVVVIPPGVSVTVGEAGEIQDGATVLLEGRMVSAVFADRFYIQDPDFASGIAVAGQTDAWPGDYVTIRGVMGTTGCERILLAPELVRNRRDASPHPLNLLGRVLGGMPEGPFNPGFADSVHLNNLGLLVGMSGWITASGPGFFYLSDGSQSSDDSGYTGVRVAAEGLAVPPVGTLLTVFGISGCKDAGYGPARIIYPRSNKDLIIRYP